MASLTSADGTTWYGRIRPRSAAKVRSSRRTKRARKSCTAPATWSSCATSQTRPLRSLPRAQATTAKKGSPSGNYIASGDASGRCACGRTPVIEKLLKREITVFCGGCLISSGDQKASDSSCAATTAPTQHEAYLAMTGSSQGDSRACRKRRSRAR